MVEVTSSNLVVPTRIALLATELLDVFVSVGCVN